MENDEQRRQKAQWLEENLYKSLKKQTEVFDVLNIGHFSADDFFNILIKVESYKGLVGIWGIESFLASNGYFFNVYTCKTVPYDANWYTEAFFKLLSEKPDYSDLYFTATFWIADELLEGYKN